MMRSDEMREKAIELFKKRMHYITIVGETAKALGELLEQEAEIMDAKKKGNSSLVPPLIPPFRWLGKDICVFGLIDKKTITYHLDLP